MTEFEIKRIGKYESSKQDIVDEVMMELSIIQK